MVPWCSGLSRLPVTQKIAGSNPVGTAIYFFGFIAQSVEQRTENPRVAGSIPAGATIGKYVRTIRTLYKCTQIMQKMPKKRKNAQ